MRMNNLKEEQIVLQSESASQQVMGRLRPQGCRQAAAAAAAPQILLQDISKYIFTRHQQIF